MLQTLFIYLQYHEVMNSFQKNKMYNKMKRRNLSRGKILSFGNFDKTSLNFPKLT